MKDMTLREVCINANVSRRAIQGYEKAGLVKATGRNERGHLLYDVNARQRIKKIKLYQQLGFTIKEIKDIIDAPNKVVKEALEDRVKKLKDKRKHMDVLISKACELIDEL